MGTGCLSRGGPRKTSWMLGETSRTRWLPEGSLTRKCRYACLCTLALLAAQAPWPSKQVRHAMT